MISFEQILQLVSAALRIGFFILMVIGLIVACIMLYFDKLSGGEWVMLCGILFGSDRIGFAISEFKK